MFFDGNTGSAAQRKTRATPLLMSTLTLAAVLVMVFPETCLSINTAPASANESLPAGGKVVAFRWFPTVSGWKTQRVVAGTEFDVPIEVEVQGDVSEISFAISAKFRDFGIGFEKETSEVLKGKAHSRVVFRIVEGMPLGRHDLGIRIFERRTGREIGSGSIPFIILPSDLECLC